MKKIDVLVWGVQHIANNHGAEYTSDYEENMVVGILSNTAPTLMDARMMCEDLGIENIHPDNFWGVITIDVEDWVDTIGQEEYKPTGREMWTRAGAKIGA